MDEPADIGTAGGPDTVRTVRMTFLRRRRARREAKAVAKAARKARKEYRPSWATRCLLWVAGADPALLDSRVEYYRAASMGAFVIIVALLGAVTFSLYVAVIVGRFVPWMLPFAAFWAVILFWLDRSILVDPHYGSLKRVEQEADAAPRASVPSPWPPATANGWHHETAPAAPAKARPRRSRMDGTSFLRLLVYLSRVTIAVIVAILISEVVVLLIFRPEISAQALATQDSRYQGKLVALGHKQQSALGPKIHNLQQRISDNNDYLRQLKQIENSEYVTYNNEATGKTISGTPGFGPLATKDADAYNHAVQVYDQNATKLGQQNDGFQGKITTLTTEQADYGNPSSPLFNSLKTTPQGKQAYAETHGDLGWLDQEDAFSAFQRSHGGFAVRWIPWLLRGLLVLIDLLPLGLKLLSSSSVYGRRVRDQGRLARYADRRLDQVRRADYDRGADLQDYRTGLATLLDYQRQERYRRDRTDHLGRPDGGFYE